MKKSLFILFLIFSAYGLTAQNYTTVATFAGNSSPGHVDNPVTSAEFYRPYGVCVDTSTGDVYVADKGNNCIRKISNGIVTTLAGGIQGDVDAQGANARIYGPSGVTFYNGYVYFTDDGNNKVKKIDAAGNVTTIAGTGSIGLVNGAALQARFHNPTDLKVTSNGDIYVADYLNHCIRKISGGQVTTYAGTGVAGDVNGPAATAKFNRPRSLCIDPLGNIFLVDMVNNKVKEITATGNVILIAGSGAAGYQDGTGTGATFNVPQGIDFELSGDLIMVDGQNHSIRRVTQAGVVTTLAGNGTTGYVDGPIAGARFDDPEGICVGPNGDVYIGDHVNNVIRTFVGSTLTAQVTSNDNMCFGGSSGSATVTPSGGTSPYTYSWAPTGGTNATANGLAAGTYTCTITDALANTYQQTVTITQPTLLTVSISTIAANCNGTGSATATTSGGTPPYFYVWSSGGNGATENNLAPGTYTVVVNDANDCSTTQTCTVTQISGLSAVAFAADVACYGMTNGTASVVASGGTAPYTYSWAPTGGTNATETNLGVGTYTCTITDANGCSYQQTVSVTQPSQLNATSSHVDESVQAANDGSATVTPNGGTPGYTYLWSPGNQTTSTINGLGGGTYTCVVTDANGCTTTTIITIGTISGINNAVDPGLLISLFPNPVQDMMQISVSSVQKETIALEIYNALGEKISVTDFGNVSSVNYLYNTSALANGVYFFRIISGTSAATKKVTVAH